MSLVWCNKLWRGVLDKLHGGAGPNVCYTAFARRDYLVGAERWVGGRKQAV
jgi:hypothetical protein